MNEWKPYFFLQCGHCGKTHPNASEFHRHSAMSHGNKIPDLVKDQAAEAEFEALKGLVEANLEIEYQASNTSAGKTQYLTLLNNFFF